MSLDPAECYRVRELALPKDEARLFFTDGYLIFAKPVAGCAPRPSSPLEVEGGEAELLLLPPNRAERRSLASYTGSPNLDEHFSASVLMFSDDTYANLTAQIRQNPFNRKSPEMGELMAESWALVVRNIAASFQTRLVLDLLSSDPRRPGFFAASMSGKKLGSFDLYYDRRALEQIVVGKLNARDSQLFFDVWCSFVARSFRNATNGTNVGVEPDFVMDDFRIEATLQPDLGLQVVTHVKIKAGSAPLAVLAFDVADSMTVSAASVDGKPAEVFQRESARADFMRNVGNEMFLIVPSEPLEPGKEHEFEIQHAGKVIFQAGNQVYYVGARANWFPENGRQFAKFDLTFRYPKELDLVTAGELVDEREEGDWRITRRKTTSPIRMAGFNLGRYQRVRTSHDGYTVEVCANRTRSRASDRSMPRLRSRCQRGRCRAAPRSSTCRRSCRPTPRAPAGLAAEDAVRAGIHGGGFWAARIAASDRIARTRAVRAGLPWPDLSFHDVLSGAAGQSHPHTGRARPPLLLRYSVRPRDGAPW